MTTLCSCTVLSEGIGLGTWCVLFFSTKQESYSSACVGFSLSIFGLKIWIPNKSCTPFIFYLITCSMILCRIPLQAAWSFHLILSHVFCIYRPDSVFFFIPRLPPSVDFCQLNVTVDLYNFTVGSTSARNVQARPFKLSVNVGLFMLISRCVLCHFSIYASKCK